MRCFRPPPGRTLGLVPAAAAARRGGDGRKLARADPWPGRTLRLADAGAGTAADARGGAVAFDVAEPGTYRVALEHKGWIDVLEAGRSLASSKHGHGPACTGIRKMVDFRLKRGRHVLRLSKLAEDEVRVLITRG